MNIHGTLLTRTDSFLSKLCVWVLVGLLTVYLIFSTLLASAPDPHGESDSFMLGAVALLKTGSYELTDDVVETACYWFPSQADHLRARFYSDFYPITDDGHKYPWYMGVYSILCTPMLIILRLFHLKIVYAFAITNSLLLVTALYVVYKFGKVSTIQKLMLILFLGLSPIVRYIEWQSYEVATFSFVVIAATFWLNRSRRLAALFLSIAGTMNPTIMAFGIMMIVDYFWDILKSENYNIVKFFGSCLKQWKNILIYAVCFTPCLFPILATHRLFHTFNLIAKTTAQTTGVLSRFWAYMVDLNFGLMPYIPIMLLLFVFICVKGLFYKRHDLFCTLIGVLGTILAFSVTMHINCGMTGIARYNAWLLPIIVMTVIYSGDELFSSAKSVSIIHGITAASIIWCFVLIGIVAYAPERGGAHYWSPLAKTVMRYAPQLYNPLYSTFNSRCNNIDGGYSITEPVLYSDEDGYVHKVLVPPGMLEQTKALLWSPNAEQSVILEEEYKKVTENDRFYYLNLGNGTRTEYIGKEYSLGKAVKFDAVDEGNKLFTNGISVIEGDFSWTDGKTGEMLLALPNVKSDLQMTLSLRYVYNNEQRVIINCGGKQLYSDTIYGTDSFIKFDIPAEYVQNGRLKLEFEYPDAITLTNSSNSDNERTLAFGYSSVLIEEVMKGESTSFTLGEKAYYDNTSNDMHLFFKNGMSSTEGDSAWTDGNNAVMSMFLGSIEEKDLKMSIGLKSIFNAPQNIVITSGDNVLLNDTIASAEAPIEFNIPYSCVQQGELIINFQFPTAVSPHELGESNDARKLAFRFMSLSLDYAYEEEIDSAA